MTFTILLTCVGDEFGPNIVNKLKDSQKNKIRVIGTDTNPNASGKHFSDFFCVVPQGDSPEYVECISSIISEYNVDLVLPKADEEALSLARNRSEIENKNCQLACAPLHVIECLTNKIETYNYLKKKGLPTPKWEKANSPGEIEHYLEKILRDCGKAVVKPAQSRGGRGVFVIQPTAKKHAEYIGKEKHLTLDAFKKNFLQSESITYPVLVMEKLVPPVFDIDLLAWKGKPIHIVPRRRAKSELPNEGHVFPSSSVLESLGEKLIEAFELSWLCDADVMFDAEGKPQVLEINPRPSGSLSTTIAAGVPVLDDLISLAKGETPGLRKKPTFSTVIPYKSIAVTKN